MHWLGKSWAEEDVEFAPIRKVGNKDSKQRPHVIGAFHSHIETSAEKGVQGAIVPKNAKQHNLQEGRRPALFKLLEGVQVSVCQKANDTNRKSPTTPREAIRYRVFVL